MDSKDAGNAEYPESSVPWIHCLWALDWHISAKYSRAMSGQMLGIWLWKVDMTDLVVDILWYISWFRICTKCINPSAVSVAMAINWAWEDFCYLAVSTALSSLSMAQFVINFSLTLNTFVPKTIRSLIISSGSLKSQSWAIICNVVTNSSSASDESWTRRWNFNLTKAGLLLQ